MSTSNEYGQFPGVRVSVSGGGISNAQIGREQKLVLFGRADLDAGSASANDPQRIRSRVQASELFGNGSPLADGIEEALANKGTYEFIYGVALQETDVSAESVSGDAGNLTNFPIVEDKDLITVIDSVDGTTEMNVEFRYESPPAAPADGDTVHINPLTGEFEDSASGSYEVDYTYSDWEMAIDSADSVLNHAEVGIYAPMTDSEDVARYVSHKASGDPNDTEDKGLRGEYKMVIPVVGAQPNATNEDGEPVIDTDTYDVGIDDDATFVAGCLRLSEDNSRTILPGLAGIFAGNALQNPIFGDRIRGYGPLTQALSRAEQEALREINVIPIVDDYRDGGEGITIEGHKSTSSATDWNRTFQNRRLTDLIILMQRRVGEAARDNLMRDQQLDEIEAQIINGFERLAREGLIHGDPDGQDNQGRAGGILSGIGEDFQQVGDEENPYFAEAVRSDVNTISIGSGFTPVGVITHVDAQITVSDNVGTFGEDN